MAREFGVRFCLTVFLLIHTTNGFYFQRQPGWPASYPLQLNGNGNLQGGFAADPVCALCIQMGYHRCIKMYCNRAGGFGFPPGYGFGYGYTNTYGTYRRWYPWFQNYRGGNGYRMYP